MARAEPRRRRSQSAQDRGVNDPSRCDGREEPFARQTPRFIEREGDVDALARVNPDRDPLASLR